MVAFRQGSAVTALSFFSNLSRAPLLASAGSAGRFCLWDLRSRSLRCERAAHAGAAHSALFLPGRWELLTAGSDNALRVWAVDAVDGSPRELRSREGHAEGASLVQFYGLHGAVAREGSFDGLALNVLSAGEDRAFRSFHVLRDALSGELSQGPAVKRLRQAAGARSRAAAMEGSAMGGSMQGSAMGSRGSAIGSKMGSAMGSTMGSAMGSTTGMGSTGKGSALGSMDSSLGLSTDSTATGFASTGSLSPSLRTHR